MIDVSHLVVNGCSFTYGNGLDNPTKDAWPAIVSKNLNLPIVNLAREGIGNDAIHRRTYEYFYEDLKNKNNPLYIICFSAITRKEFWSEYLHMYRGIHVNNVEEKDMTHTQKSYVENYNLTECLRSTLLYKNSLSNLFKAHNVPYIFFSLLYLGIDEQKAKNQLSKIFPHRIILMNKDPCDLKNQNTILGNNYTKLPCGHYDVETNHRLGEYISENITKLYNFNPVKKPFMTLDQYTKTIEPYYDYWEQKQEFGAWL